jgi:hypothetical protein
MGRHVPDPYDWAVRFETQARCYFKPLIEYDKLGREATLSIATPDHHLPLLYVLATKQERERITFAVEGVYGGSISVLAVRLAVRRFGRESAMQIDEAASKTRRLRASTGFHPEPFPSIVIGVAR